MFAVCEVDVLVIGAGGAGTLAAIEASADAALRVAVVSRGPISQCGLTATANGGTARATSPEAFFDEMVTAGEFLNDQNLVWFLANQINPSLERLQGLGLDLISYKPTRCCVPSVISLQTFRSILARRPNVRLFEDVLITSLLKERGRVAGALGLDLRSGEFLRFRARVVVLASGGSVGDLYPLSSDNPFGISSCASGIGHRLAFEAGAELVDMEMIQFVPIPTEPAAARNLRFFPDFWASPYYDRHGKVLLEDASQFVANSYSYSFARLVHETERRGDGPVYIDQTRVDEASVPKGKVPVWGARRARFKLLNINPFERPIKISIGSHFNMGGVYADEHAQSSIPGLLAAGEVAGALHGALRIHGFSFSQMIVFGMEAGRRAAELTRDMDLPAPPDRAEEAAEQRRLEGFFRPKRNPVSVTDVLDQLQKVMQEHVFLVRSEAGLLQAREAVRALREEAFHRVQVAGSRRFNLDWARALDLEAAIDTAAVVVESALARQESRGFHWRRDFPTAADHLPRHTVAHNRDGQLQVGMAPVIMSRRVPGGEA